MFFLNHFFHRTAPAEVENVFDEAGIDTTVPATNNTAPPLTQTAHAITLNPAIEAEASTENVESQREPDSVSKKDEKSMTPARRWAAIRYAAYTLVASAALISSMRYSFHFKITNRQRELMSFRQWKFTVRSIINMSSIYLHMHKTVECLIWNVTDKRKHRDWFIWHYIKTLPNSETAPFKMETDIRQRKILTVF